MAHPLATRPADTLFVNVGPPLSLYRFRYVLEHCRVHGAKWSLKGAKPVAEQMKRKQSRRTEEVSVQRKCRSTLTLDVD
ncbi:hypothetical protein YC2023_053523 [Brassica napus]